MDAFLDFAFPHGEQVNVSFGTEVLVERSEQGTVGAVAGLHLAEDVGVFVGLTAVALDRTSASFVRCAPEIEAGALFLETSTTILTATVALNFLIGQAERLQLILVPAYTVAHHNDVPDPTEYYPSVAAGLVIALPEGKSR